MLHANQQCCSTPLEGSRTTRFKTQEKPTAGTFFKDTPSILTEPRAQTPQMPTVIYSHPLRRFLVTPEYGSLKDKVCRVEMSQKQRQGLRSQCLTPLSPPPPLPPPTCLMCRSDLNTESFRGCQAPQSESKEDSAGHLVSSRPSAPSGRAGPFSSSSASELSQLSDSSSNSAKRTTQISQHAALGSSAPWMSHDHFSPRHLVVKLTRRLLTSRSGQLATLLAASGALGGWEGSVCVLSMAGGRSRAKAEQSTQALP